MAETATNTRPSRARKPAASTATKATPAKAASAKAATTPAKQEPVNVDRFTVAFEHVGTTKSYERFDAPASFKGTVVGSVYAPIGTTRVGVVVIGVEAPEAAE